MKVKIYAPGDKKPLTAEQVASHANKVHQMFAQGSPYTADMYEEHEGKDYRLKGYHCDCGYDLDNPANSTLGKFELLPINSEEVQDGHKAYMVCRKCGHYSHL